MNKKYIIIGIIILVGLILFWNLKNIITGDTIQKQEKYEEWLKNNCNCIEKERLKCREGYELDGKLCKGWKSVTNPISTCSQYDCAEEIVNWDKDKEEWIPVINK